MVLEVILGERFWAFRDLILDLLPKCYPESFVPKPRRLPENLLQGLGKWQHLPFQQN